MLLENVTDKKFTSHIKEKYGNNLENIKKGKKKIELKDFLLLFILLKEYIV